MPFTKGNNTMKKLILILLLPLFFSSCFFDKEQTYQQDTAVELDTLDVEQVKIATH